MVRISVSQAEGKGSTPLRDTYYGSVPDGQGRVCKTPASTGSIPSAPTCQQADYCLITKGNIS